MQKISLIILPFIISGCFQTITNNKPKEKDLLKTENKVLEAQKEESKTQELGLNKEVVNFDTRKAVGWNLEELALADNLEWSDIEKDVLLALNMARINPKKFSEDFVKPMLDQFKGNVLVRNDRRIVRKEGVKAVEETITFLEKQPKSEVFKPANGMRLSGLDHINDTGPDGLVTHTGSDDSSIKDRVERYGTWDITLGENIEYGSNNGLDIVLNLIIDDGVENKGHRVNIFNPEFKFVGVAYGTHSKFNNMCVQNFAGLWSDK